MQAFQACCANLALLSTTTEFDKSSSGGVTFVRDATATRIGPSSGLQPALARPRAPEGRKRRGHEAEIASLASFSAPKAPEAPRCGKVSGALAKKQTIQSFKHSVGATRNGRK